MLAVLAALFQFETHSSRRDDIQSSALIPRSRCVRALDECEARNLDLRNLCRESSSPPSEFTFCGFALAVVYPQAPYQLAQKRPNSPNSIKVSPACTPFSKFAFVGNFLRKPATISKFARNFSDVRREGFCRTAIFPA
jgi:hypothetical protein